jgi:hypothetical protein
MLPLASSLGQTQGTKRSLGEFLWDTTRIECQRWAVAALGATGLTACGRASARTRLCPTCSWRRQHAIDGGTSLPDAARFTDLAVAAHWREFRLESVGLSSESGALVLGSVRPTTINGRCGKYRPFPDGAARGSNRR